jgi:hypothetical protein
VPPQFRRGYQGVFAFVRHDSHYYDERGSVSTVRPLRERGGREGGNSLIREQTSR